MKPTVFLFAFGMFATCLLAHVIWWRWKKPNRDALALLTLFLTPAFFLAITGRIDLIAAALLHTALSVAYILLYPASQADSPSLRILLRVERAKPLGLTGREIQNFFHDDELFDARIRDLVEAGLAEKKGTRLALTRKGHGFFLPFLLLRKVLGLTPGKG